MEAEDPTFFGLVLSTHRPKNMGIDATSYFPYEPLIAAISIVFFRTTVSFQAEPLALKWFFSLLLAFLAYSRKSYELITAVELFSYSVPYLLIVRDKFGQQAITRLLYISGSALVSLLLVHLAANGSLFRLFVWVTPNLVVRSMKHLIPVDEMVEAYEIMVAFLDERILVKQLRHLFFVTFHIQVGMGYLGIDFLRKEQDRRNQLVRMDVGSTEGKKRNGVNRNSEAMMERARQFQRSAPAFILLTALPYMSQIILYGNVNKFAFMCVLHDLHRTVRLSELFDHDRHLIAMANESPTTPEGMLIMFVGSGLYGLASLIRLGYATSMNTVVSTAYEIFNRKMFSLPKVLLLPSVMSKQPMLVAQVFPFIILSDWLKASAVAFMTRKIEQLERELQEIRAIRTKVESFDIKNAELLQRSGKGATQFTQRRWEALTTKVHARVVISDLLSRSKGFFAFIQRNFVFSVLIDCALANLIALGKIVSNDTFVFSRAIEDAVDMILMRSRGEAELARMDTEIRKLRDLSDIWERSKDRSLLRCNLAQSPGDGLVLRNLLYSRGTANVRADHIELKAGVYALTGSNGSGKSTLFRLLMSCDTNEKPIDMPSSINLLSPMEPLTEVDDVRRGSCCEASDESADSSDDDFALAAQIETTGDIALAPERALDYSTQLAPKLSVTMPSSHVIEISQTVYWPLHSRPIDWIYLDQVVETFGDKELKRRTQKIVEELVSLEFFQRATLDEPSSSNDAFMQADDGMRQRIATELLAMKDDWFGELSGGQKSKVELVRKVFRHEKCPDVLLVDETMAPLDPASKSRVMLKLKTFCKESVVIVIYHTDVGQERKLEGKAVECVPSNDFFDKNIHLEGGIVRIRETC